MSLPKSLFRFALCLGFILVICQGTARADDQVDRRKLFADNVKGCVAVMTTGGPATGFVVDVNKRLIVSCQHVVGTKEEVDILFPAYKDGKLIQERNYYLKTATKVKGKIVSANNKCDLCLIQVDALPEGTQALRLASDSGQPGDNLNLIGNPAASGAMWNYTIGTLRAVYKKKFTYKNTSHEVEAIIGETQLPANPGDSGGAVFNDKGEVLGVHSGGTPDAVQLMATYIDVVELRRFIDAPFQLTAKASTFEEFFTAANDHFHKNEIDKAIEAYTKAIKLNPNHSEAWRSRASAYIRKKQYDKALTDCNEAISCNRANAKAYNDRAVCHGAKGDYQAAIADYDEAIRFSPKEALYYAGRAWANNGLKEHHKAISDADQAIRLKSDYALALRERGLANLWLKDYDKALDDLNQAVKIEKTNFETLYYRGVTFASLKKSAEAIKDFDEVVKLNPKYAPAYKERGTLHYQNKDYQLAAKDYSEAINLNSKDAQAYLWRSW
ncbi:MAG TPA: tetratricopeptide repeat protein, partial [Gemmataceae bacterium]|nr:tetratricopeptide repeat protein [Gemmataceae bacterium]